MARLSRPTNHDDEIARGCHRDRRGAACHAPQGSGWWLPPRDVHSDAPRAHRTHDSCCFASNKNKEFM